MKSCEKEPALTELLCVEHNFTKGSPMYEWLEKDLMSVDRSVTPWYVCVFMWIHNQSLILSTLHMASLRLISLIPECDCRTSCVLLFRCVPCGFNLQCVGVDILAYTQSLTHSPVTPSLTSFTCHRRAHSLVTHFLTFTHSLTHSLTHTLTHTHTRSLTHALTHSHSPVTYSLTHLSLTHAHTHARTPTHAM